MDPSPSSRPRGARPAAVLPAQTMKPPRSSKNRLDQALRAGFDARLRGRPITDAPPFHGGNLDEREAWMAGWRAADRGGRRRDHRNE